jgi:hypothetical protein
MLPEHLLCLPVMSETAADDIVFIHHWTGTLLRPCVLSNGCTVISSFLCQTEKYDQQPPSDDKRH